MSREMPEVRFGLPPLATWQRNLIAGLAVAYLVEVVLNLAGVPLYTWLPWWSFGHGFEAWQPLTRFLVQGAHRGAVIWVLFALLMVYFFLPMLDRVLERRKIAEGVLAGAIVGTLLPLAVDATGLLASPPALGWGSLTIALAALYGLAAPDEQVLLLFFPVKARVLLWGSLALAGLYLLVDPTLDTFEGVGVWLGAFGWWHLLGPGARRRTLRDQARDIESELRRFQVLEGGKDKGDKPQGPQNGGDDWVH